MYGDFEAVDSNALDKLVADLQGLRLGSQSRGNSQISSEPLADQGTTGTAKPQDTTESKKPDSSNSHTSESQEPVQDDQLSATNGVAVESFLDLNKPGYFELCVNTGGHTVCHREIELGGVKSDGRLFEKVWCTYSGVRGFRMKRIFIKPVDVHFVYVSKQIRG